MCLVQVTSETRLLICSQVPGRRVHESGLPFDDPQATVCAIGLGWITPFTGIRELAWSP